MNSHSNVARVDEYSWPVERTRVRWRWVLKGLGFTLLMGLAFFKCNTSGVTVFQASFNNEVIGSAPKFNTDTGTLSFNAQAGRVKVVERPAPNVSSTKWVQITEDSMRGNFSRFDGPGNYGMVGNLFIPSTTAGIVTLSFVADFGSQPDVHFLHLDFMPQGNVRVDDDEATRFGQFPKDKPFTVAVKLAITSTTGTAEITLFGEGASGTRTVNIQPLLMTPARRFFGVRFFMGFQQLGTFFVKDIIVRRT